MKHFRYFLKKTVVPLFCLAVQVNLYAQNLSKEETINYIRDLSRKATGLTINYSTSNFKGSISEIDFYFNQNRNAFTFNYKVTNIRESLDNTKHIQYNIDLTTFIRFELSPNVADDSPATFLRIFLDNNSVGISDDWGDVKPSRDYFSVPFPNTTENYNRLIKAFRHLIELERKNKKNDPFDD